MNYENIKTRDDALIYVTLYHINEVRRICQHLAVDIPLLEYEDGIEEWLRENIEDIRYCVSGSVDLKYIRDEVASLIPEKSDYQICKEER